MELKIFLFRLFLALFLGAGIGIERQIKQRSAGLVTNSLVSLGAAIYVLIAIRTNNGSEDSLRVLAQIVTGIGFLGAGVIMRDGFTVHGLNTAATIWCSAAVGSLAGYGLWLEGIIAAGTVVSSHLLFKPIIEYINSRPNGYKLTVKNLGYVVRLRTQPQNESLLKTLCTQYLSDYDGLQLRAIKLQMDNKNAEIVLEILAYEPGKTLIEKLVARLSQLSIVEEIRLDTLREEISM